MALQPSRRATAACIQSWTFAPWIFSAAAAVTSFNVSGPVKSLNFTAAKVLCAPAAATVGENCIRVGVPLIGTVIPPVRVR